MRVELDLARTKLAELEQRHREALLEIEGLRAQREQLVRLCELQKADLERYRQQYEAVRPAPPERVPPEELQLALERVLAHDPGPANQQHEQSATAEPAPAPPSRPEPRRPRPRPRRRDRHGRRRLDLTKLPVQVIEVVPDEVKATGGVGFQRIGEDVSDRLAFRASSYLRLRVIRGKYIRSSGNTGSDSSSDLAQTGSAARAVATESSRTATEAQTRTESASTLGPGAEAGVCANGVENEATAGAAAPAPSLAAPGDAEPPVLIAPLPDTLWPRLMADPSAVAQGIVAKYADLLPLHRQEGISARHGFRLPRSTQAGWFRAAFAVLFRIVEAMFAEAKASAFCIATDATGAPVRPPNRPPGDPRVPRKTARWHVFVFIADRAHVVFRYTSAHTSAAAQDLLSGFKGRLLSDASAIFDILHRGGVIEIACWAHFRRYVVRALESSRPLAMELLAIIHALFEVDRECQHLPLPERTRTRGRRAWPLLRCLDAWIAKHGSEIDPRSPLHTAIGYYHNQRRALRRFLIDGRLRLDNNLSELELRSLVIGLHNWIFFANETGLKWYATFRSLIASCALHGLNSQIYLEQVLRLAPHWPASRCLELSPRYWQTTVAGLTASQRALLERPWEPGIVESALLENPLSTSMITEAEAARTDASPELAAS